MVDELRRQGYSEQRVLIETGRVLVSSFPRYLLVVSGAQVELLRNLMQYLGRESTFASEYGDGYYLSPTAEEWDSLLATIADLEDALMEIALGFYSAYVSLRDLKGQGVDGGTFTSGAWRTRDLNVEHADAAGICELEGNGFTLAAGTYRFFATAPCFNVAENQLGLYNVTSAAMIALGASVYAAPGGHGELASMNARFIIGDDQVLSLLHRGAQTQAVTGFGKACNWNNELYACVELWKES